MLRERLPFAGQICWGGYTLRENTGYTPRGGLGAGTGPKLDQNGPKKNKKNAHVNTCGTRGKLA